MAAAGEFDWEGPLSIRRALRMKPVILRAAASSRRTGGAGDESSLTPSTSPPEETSAATFFGLVFIVLLIFILCIVVIIWFCYHRKRHQRTWLDDLEKDSANCEANGQCERPCVPCVSRCTANITAGQFSFKPLGRMNGARTGQLFVLNEDPIVLDDLILSQDPETAKSLTVGSRPKASPDDGGSLIMTSKSTNWSGYVAAQSMTTPVTNSCSSVTGTFIVPKILPGVTSSMNNVSIWVGLDGAFVTDPTVQQIGIDLYYKNGRSYSYAWFEMYPASAYQIVGFPINAGESITATVTFSSVTNAYTMSMINNTRRVGITVPTGYTRSSSGRRQCVEWVVEAPSYVTGRNVALCPLTQFSTITWSNCQATIAGVTGGIGHFAHDNFVMVSQTNSNKIKAAPTALSGADGSVFSVSWAAGV